MEVSASFNIRNLTLGELKNELEKVSEHVEDSATVRVSVIEGDRPWESDVYSLQIKGEAK